jgi:hypothetical protein
MASASDIVIEEINLKNGLKVLLIDQTRHYFGGYYCVMLAIHCEIPVTAQYFTSHATFADAIKVLGKSIEYRRIAEQMGVARNDSDAVLKRLIDDFKLHSLPYLSSPHFPGKFILRELRRSTSLFPRYAAPND